VVKNMAEPSPSASPTPGPGLPRTEDPLRADLAFVGLSQVRESAVFSGIPITERLAPEERTCGVCVVDLRRGEAIALLKFESGVQEVFAVATLPRRFPELINENQSLLENSFVVPTECLGTVAATVRFARSRFSLWEASRSRSWFLRRSPKRCKKAEENARAGYVDSLLRAAAFFWGIKFLLEFFPVMRGNDNGAGFGKAEMPRKPHKTSYQRR